MKKKLLSVTLFFLFIILASSNSLSLSSEFKPFECKELNYSYDALEPYVDKETMMLHYNKHYKNYVDKLNDTIKKYPKLYSCSLTDLLSNLDCLPDSASQIIKNNGGGIYNHEFFFSIMTNRKTYPSEELKKAIDRDFGSFDEFKKEFKEASLDIFGSGWVWLAKDKDGKLSITKEANGSNPVAHGLKPILGFDVWEHAYYLDYRNRRPDHLNALWKIIDWDTVGKRY